MTNDDQNIAALMGSRLCHDLVSPLGAIGNGVELLRMTQPSTPELDLVEEAVKAAQARIRLFRLAFGQARDDQTLPGRDVSEALTALSANGRISVVTDLPATVSRRGARRLALAALCAESALAWGGTITVSVDGLSAKAARFKRDEALWQALATGAAPLDLASSTVHFGLLAQSGAVSLAFSDTTLSITL